MTKDVLVVIGIGGMGQAIARRCSGGHELLLADFDAAALNATAETLRSEGHAVTAQPADVGDPASMAALADRAATLGRVSRLVHTAGVSPAQATSEVVVRVDVVGVALFLQEFARVVAAGGAGVVIASMAGHLAPRLPKEQRDALRTTPPAQLLALPFLAPAAVPDSAAAYSVAKAANHLQVQVAAGPWGERGARINSISPGIISTPMGQQELASESGEHMRAMIAMSGTKRLGTAEDIAAATDFLLGPHSSFITGTDLLVDGGAVAAVRPLLP